MAKKRYAQVGLGSRSKLFTTAVVAQYSDTAEMVGFCDNNQGRLNLASQWARGQDLEVPTYGADQFDRMIAETKPDVVIVTTMDATHDHYICRAMELGCDVITEKPMTTDEHKCQRIIDTRKKTGRNCTVTFNYRYSPPRTQVKDLLMSGVIGDVVSVDFHWLLDTRHGADYFRRWHRSKRNSGGLMVHKATHHFDMVNWWLSTVPEEVYAVGKRNFYRPETAERYGLENRAERCLDCPEGERCSFHLDMREYPALKLMYLENEKYDGYYRDRCVFSGDIDIEDTMHLTVKYRTGALMSYSLHSFMPWEGYVVYFNGTCGRLEHITQETVYISGDGSVPGEIVPEGTKINIFPHFKPAYGVEIWRAEGGHGGADPLMVKDILDPEPSEDKYKRAADYRAGAWSILTGVAANRSMESGRKVRVSELVRGLEDPDYPPMPVPTDPLDAAVVQSAAPEWFKKEQSKKE
jgi:predicted dehydrogenase